MGAPQAIDALADRANLLRDSLHRSHTNTGSMVAILGSFDHRLSALEAAMRPTQVRTHAIRTAHENIDKTLKSAEVILNQFDLTRQAEAKILRGPHEDLESYIEAVDQLRGIIGFFRSNKSFKTSDGVLNHCNALLVKSVLKLEEEFRQLLGVYSKPVEPDRLFDCLPNSLRPSSGSPGHQGDGAKTPSTTSENQAKLDAAIYTPPTLIPPRILPLLHDLAQQLIHAGNQVQCLKIYREARASSLEQSLRKLGVERLAKDDVQKMQWEVLEAKIGNWIHYMRIAVKLLFAGERKICEQLFDIDTQRDQCFAEVTGNSVAMLLSFGDAIARSKRSPEKLFVLLDMYEIMHELQPESGFEGFVRDRYTVLPETRERMLATEVTASWRYGFDHLSHIPTKPFCFTERYRDVRNVLVSTFFGEPNVGVYSPSVQNTLYLMAKAVLNRFVDIASVQLRMPNLHFLPVNIAGKDNPAVVKFADDVYLPTDEPHGTIEATLTRSRSKL